MHITKGLVQVDVRSYGCKAETPKKPKCTYGWKPSRKKTSRLEVGHLGFWGIGFNLGYIQGGGDEHGKDIRYLRVIQDGFIHAKASARSRGLGDGRIGCWSFDVINTSVLGVAEGRRVVVSFSKLCGRAIHNTVIQCIVFGVINSRCGIHGRM